MQNIADYNMGRLIDELDGIDERIENEGELKELIELKDSKTEELKKWCTKSIELNKKERKKLPIEDQLRIQRESDEFIESLINLDVEKLEEDIRNGKTEFN